MRTRKTVRRTCALLPRFAKMDRRSRSRDDDGQMIGIAAVLHDVTARFDEMKLLRKEILLSN